MNLVPPFLCPSDPAGQPHKVQYLPARFTVDSEVIVEIPDSGDKKLDFDLR
mgnify:CR=1 FL=1